METLTKLARLLPGLVLIAAVLICVEQLVNMGVIKRVLVPPPTVVGRTLFDLVAAGEFFAPLASTLLLFGAGLIIAALLGIALGMLMGTSRLFNDLLDPLIELIRPMPKAALVPVLILFLGLGATMKVTSVALASFFPILINTIQGVRGVDPVLLATGRTFGRTRLQIAFEIVLPAAVPYIAAGLRVAVGLALLMTVLSEMLAGTGGLGAIILENQRAFRIRQMYAWLVVLAVIGLVINAIMEWTERRMIPWVEQSRP